MLALAVLVTTVSAGPGAFAATTPPKLLLAENFPDPSVSQFGSHYYGYATGTESTRAPLATAPAATGPWQARGDAMPERPAWMAERAGIWAPDVTRRADGRYLMHFSGERAADGTMCIGAALAERPGGPFTPLGAKPLVCERGDGGDIDPSLFVDADGRAYLVYKSNGHQDEPPVLWLQPMRADGVTRAGHRVELLRSDRPEEHGVVEAPTLVRQPSQYVLFYSIRSFTDPGYQTTYATAPALAGPYTKSGEPLISRQSLGKSMDGPGSADITTGTDGRHAFFHGWLDRDREIRALYLVGLRYVDGRPVLEAPDRADGDARR